MQDRFRDACRTGDLDAVKYILSDLSEEDVLQLIHQSGYPGYEGHRPFMTGSPLFEAVLANQLDIVDYIAGIGYDLEHECDVHISYPVNLHDRCTALCVACACGATEVARVLLKHGADVNHTSRHSSPVIYASECRDATLASLLLQNGADVSMVPHGLQSYAAVLPLYQACLNGHKETAELFLEQSKDSISHLKQVCFLALLGAQCINRHGEFESGIEYWRRALILMTESNYDIDADNVLRVFQQFHFDCHPAKQPSPSVIVKPTNLTGSVPSTRGAMSVDQSTLHSIEQKTMKHSFIFRDVHLCRSVDELNEISGNHPALVLQALLVLQTILGPSHTETLQQVCQAARLAHDDGDLSRSCWLYLYIIECSESCDQTDVATDYSSQLAEMLLNINNGAPVAAVNDLRVIQNLPDFLVSAIDLVCAGMTKMQLALFPRSAVNSSKPDTVEVKMHCKVRLFTEMVETLMSFLRLFVVAEQTSVDHWKRVEIVVADLLSLCHSTTPQFSKFSVESEMLKIAVHSDHSTLSTLYFFQEDLFPDVHVTNLLLKCGADVNCRDFQGDTPLHHAVDCTRSNVEIIETLISRGAHVDSCNRQGVSPLLLLQQQSSLLQRSGVVNLFDLVTLRCLAARVVIKAGIDYRSGVVPAVVEQFILLHAAPDVSLRSCAL